MPEFLEHNSSDWCHVCGQRGKPQVDIVYSINAEMSSRRSSSSLSEYFRICSECLEKANAVVKDNKVVAQSEE